MKIRKGQSRIAIAPIDSLHGAYWDENKGGGNTYALCVVSIGEMQQFLSDKHKTKLLKRPTYIAFSRDGLVFHPPAAKGGNMIVRYAVMHEV